MRPVRVTTPGAGAALPLRMVAAGTGAITPITLWVLGEGRYEPKGVPTFEIKPTDIVWDWDSQSSNYARLKSDQFAASDGKAWLVEGAEPVSRYAVEGPLQQLVQYDVKASGYGEGDAAKAQEELTADLAKLVGTLDEGSLWWSRAHGELSRAALASDLGLGAAGEQLAVTRDFEAGKTTGTAPACPSFPPCDEDVGGGSGAGGAWQGAWAGNGSAQPSNPSGGCAIGADGDAGYLTALAGLGLAAFAARRRRR